jgi:SAM-dependent methyltransferase
MNRQDQQRYIERYSNRFREYGYDPLTLGWGNGGRQEIRFRALMQVAENGWGSVLDVGCGFSDLFGYLQSIGWKGRYVGIDLVPVLLDEARQRYPGVEVYCQDLLEGAELGTFDYVVASGIFNAKLHHESNTHHIAAMLQKMFELSTVAVAADFLSTLVDFQAPDAFHSNPLDILKTCLGLSRRSVLRHDYLPFEFCVYMYRHNIITSQSTYSERSD